MEIREIREDEIALLQDFLYEAIFIPEGVAPQANYAVKMYKNVGFEIVDENEEEYIMLCNLT